jgi:hypothetical protein
MSLGAVYVCLSCCCGNTSKGRPEVPVENLTQIWLEEDLQNTLPLKICACLGYCQQANVVLLRAPHVDVWLGGLETESDYRSLVNWAIHSRSSGNLMALPEPLWSNVFEPIKI